MSLKKYWQIIVLFFLWLFASWALFGSRFIPTHDGEYHLIRIYEFSKMLAAGNIIPRWAPGLDSQYGFPLFIFHYPFPNYVGSLFRFLQFPLVQSFQMSMAVGMFVGALGCYLFLKKEFPDQFSTFLGTVLFLTIPYLYVDVYIRGSIGEVWGIAWASMALAAMVWNKKVLLAISIGCLIISHNIMAMVLIPVLFGYAIFFYRQTIFHFFLGIFLSAYFWIPALWEAKYVIGLNSVTFTDHFPDITQLLFPSWGSGFSQPGIVANEMSQQIGIVPLLILFLVMLNLFQHLKCLCCRSIAPAMLLNSSGPGQEPCSGIRKIPREYARNDDHNQGYEIKSFYFLLITFISIFFMFPISIPLWKLFSFLQYTQYPWRLLSVLLLTIPFLGSSVLLSAKPFLKWGVIIAAVLLTFAYMQPVTYEPRNDAYYLTKKEFTDGTSSIGNSFTTIWTPWKKERPQNPIDVTEGTATISGLLLKPTSDQFTIESTSGAILRINRLYYPGWTVRMDNVFQSINPKDGVIYASTSKGRHSFLVSFDTTGDRFWANIISLCSITILISSFILRKEKEL